MGDGWTEALRVETQDAAPDGSALMATSRKLLNGDATSCGRSARAACQFVHNEAAADGGVSRRKGIGDFHHLQPGIATLTVVVLLSGGTGLPNHISRCDGAGLWGRRASRPHGVGDRGSSFLVASWPAPPLTVRHTSTGLWPGEQLPLRSMAGEHMCCMGSQLYCSRVFQGRPNSNANCDTSGSPATSLLA